MLPILLSISLAAAAPAPVVNFEVTGLLVNVTKPNGDTWDLGPSSIPSGAFARLMALALDGPPNHAAALAQVGRLAVDAASSPDLRVKVEILQNGQVVGVRHLPLQRDTHSPGWSGNLIEGLPATPEYSVRLTIIDDDVRFDDPVGVLVFPATSLVAVADRRTVVWTSGAKQTQGAVLYAGVTAWVVPPQRKR